MLIAAPGFLSEPSIPALPGLEDLRGQDLPHRALEPRPRPHRAARGGPRHRRLGDPGRARHPADRRAPRACSSARRRGSCRTATGRSPTSSGASTGASRRCSGLVRAGVYWSRELLVPGFVRAAHDEGAPADRAPPPREAGRRPGAAREADSELRDAAASAILPSNDWYPALTQPNVELVTDGIREVRPNGIVTADGKLHEVDTIVFATGFHVTDISLANIDPRPDGVLDVRDLEAAARRPTAARRSPASRTSSSSPGPNTGLGHNSLALHDRGPAELSDGCAAPDARSAARRGSRSGASAGGLQRRLQRRMGRTVWNSGGCSSWYLDVTGKTRRSGPTSPGATGRRRGASIPRRTSWRTAPSPHGATSTAASSTLPS